VIVPLSVERCVGRDKGRPAGDLLHIEQRAGACMAGLPHRHSGGPPGRGLRPRNTV